jgi:hypothetical protein
VVVLGALALRNGADGMVAVVVSDEPDNLSGCQQALDSQASKFTVAYQVVRGKGTW